jgi:hypothetical protein
MSPQIDTHEEVGASKTLWLDLARSEANTALEEKHRTSRPI